MPTLLKSILGVVACSALIGAAGCSKGEKEDTSAAENTVTPTDTKSGGDLEAAIADPGAKKITAVGASGKEKVLAVGETTLAETDTYVVSATVPTGTAAGADAMVTINLHPKTGWKINQEYPTKLKVAAPEGVSVEKDTLKATDAGTFSEKTAVFQVKLNAASAGPKDIAATFNFAVCTDATCDPKVAELAWKLDVI